DETRGEWWARIEREVKPAIEELQARVVADELFQPRAIYGFFPAVAEGNALVVLDQAGDERARFDFPRQPGGRRLCLSDYFRERGGEPDILAAQVVTLGPRVAEREKELFEAGQFTEYLYLHGLAVETTEGFAEWLHQRVRQEWGIAGQDSGAIEGLFRQEYQGARYSFGYPACPRLEDHLTLFKLLEPERIGVTLSEEYMQLPEVSTSALVVHHPEARYFSAAAAEGTPELEAKP
ncbi:MAG: methionine synthase, partial [Armatimonadetes bacterium]|nr:methionine synthase [Armatimonadota bacterium]